MESRRSLSVRLFAGLLLSLLALAIYAGYTATQLRLLRRLQTETIDSNRRDSLLLVRVQNDFNILGLALRDMLDAKGNYPLTAWRAQFQRVRTDLDDAFARESKVAPGSRTPDQERYIMSSVAQFWTAIDQVFDLASRDPDEAREQIRLSLEARQAAISTSVSRLLVQNNETEEQAFERTRAIHEQVERNLYIFLAAMLIAITVISAYLINHNRRVFDQLTSLSQRRGELAQQLISVQENTFRSISRELHDDFGQILTAVGAMLQRSTRLTATNPEKARAELREIQEVVQSTLEKVRSLSQALHPVMLEEVGFESAVAMYIPVFERRTGVATRFTQTGPVSNLSSETATHLYRVLQEALNNVVRHSGSKEAEVRLSSSAGFVTLEIEDRGSGFPDHLPTGIGLVSMRERAEIAGGRIEFLHAQSGGALVRMTVPASASAQTGETHVTV